MYDLFEVVIFGLILLLIVDGLLSCFGQLRILIWLVMEELSIKFRCVGCC
jgi:hypothetical protein